MALPKGITNAVPVSGDAEITGAKTFNEGPYRRRVHGDGFSRRDVYVFQRPGRQGGDVQPHYHQRRSRHGHMAGLGQVGFGHGSYAYGVRSGCPDVPYS